MSNEVPWYVSLIVSWLPLVLLQGAIVWHGRQIRRPMMTTDGRSIAQVFEDLAREVKRANDLRDGSRP